MGADLPQDFWSGWVVVITVISFVGLFWMIYGIYFQKDPGHGKETEPVWDRDMQEGNNPAPLWWFWLIFAAMIFSVMYLMLYPGLGSFAGAFQWSQGGQYASHRSLYEVEFEARREALGSMSLAELAEDELAMNAAQRLFIDNCAACHGANARGQANLFPNLRDNDWLWGGETAQIEQSIRAGRNAVMIGWQDSLGEEGVANVADYVMRLSRSAESRRDHPGQMQYQQFCIACHGPDGDGNTALGAPRLNDDVWLYGNTMEDVRRSIAGGRMGVMPAFGEDLDDLQINLLIAWLIR